MQRRRFLLAAGVTTFGTSTPAVAAPLVVHDALGRVVTISAPPQRIVPIFASNTEIAASLGLADRIVGIEAYTRFPPEVLDRPLVGGRLGFSVDAVASWPVRSSAGAWVVAGGVDAAPPLQIGRAHA